MPSPNVRTPDPSPILRPVAYNVSCHPLDWLRLSTCHGDFISQHACRIDSLLTTSLTSQVMARKNQEPKSTFLMESRADNGSLLAPSSNRDPSPSQDHKYTRRARQLLSFSAVGESLIDLLIATCCTYFIVFAALVYSRRDEPVTRSGNQALLDAAKYVSRFSEFSPVYYRYKHKR